jgi:hypothetical protein
MKYLDQSKVSKRIHTNERIVISGLFAIIMRKIRGIYVLVSLAIIM